MLDPIGDKSVQLGSTLAFSVTATDSDVGDVLTYAGLDLPAGASLSPAGAFQWTPTPAQVGSFPGVTFNALDGSLADGENITITVTAPPQQGGGTTGTGSTATTPKKCKKGRKLKQGKCVKKKRKRSARRSADRVPARGHNERIACPAMAADRPPDLCSAEAWKALEAHHAEIGGAPPARAVRRGP